MTKQDKPSEHILHSLQERAKELNCLYQVEEILSRTDDTVDDVGTADRRGASQGLPALGRLPGEGHAPREGVRAGRFRRDRVASGGRHIPPGRIHRRGRGFLHRGKIQGRRGAVPQGREASHQRGGGEARPFHPAEKAPFGAQELGGRRREDRRSRARRLVGHSGLHTADRPQASHAHHAKDDQPPLLGGRERSAGDLSSSSSRGAGVSAWRTRTARSNGRISRTSRSSPTKRFRSRSSTTARKSFFSFSTRGSTRTRRRPSSIRSRTPTAASRRSSMPCSGSSRRA